MRAEDKVNEGVALFYLLDISRFLHHAAADRNFHQGILFLEVADPAQVAESTLVSVIPDRAGIKDHKISVFFGDELEAALP